MKLTKNQQAFIDKHQIPLSALFDAKGMNKKDYHPLMKLTGKWVALGTTPCRKEGHTMRTRNGSCMQCNELAHVFLKRHIDQGQVYIAGSVKHKIIKIGTTKDYLERMVSLCDFGYGGATDWKPLIVFKVEKAGHIEFMAQAKIGDYAFPATYFKDGYTVDCLELFKCSFTRAEEALIGCLPDNAEEVFKDNDLAQTFNNLTEERGEHVRHYPGGRPELQLTETTIKADVSLGEEFAINPPATDETEAVKPFEKIFSEEAIDTKIAAKQQVKRHLSNEHQPSEGQSSTLTYVVMAGLALLLLLFLIS